MARGESKYKITNYTGHAPLRSEPADQGELRLTPERLELHFKGTKQFNHGGLRRYGFRAVGSGPESCHVTLIDKQTQESLAAFDAQVSADELERDLAERDKVLAAAKQREAKVASGSWWLAPKAFRGLGFLEHLDASETQYLGGWSSHTKTYKAKYVRIDAQGISLRGLKTIFTIPWDQVLDLEVEGPESASKRVTAGRVLALGVFALAAKKKTQSAVLIVSLRSGEEAVFQTEKLTAAELRAKLVPVTSQLRKANVSPPPTAATSPPAAPLPAAPVSVADELKKLADLKDAGLLTNEEFAGQKAKLLGS